VTLIPKYLNSATFSTDLLVIIKIWFCPTIFCGDKYILIFLCVYVCKLLASIRVPVVFSINVISLEQELMRSVHFQSFWHDLRFSRRWRFKSMSSGLWRRVVLRQDIILPRSSDQSEDGDITVLRIGQSVWPNIYRVTNRKSRNPWFPGPSW
jgi:hypothetical protein